MLAKKEEVRELLGKPDLITEAVCCYSGRAETSTNKVEMWMYYIETEKSATDKTPVPKALKIYFDLSVNPHVGERNGDHSYFPMVGYFQKLIYNRKFL